MRFNEIQVFSRAEHPVLPPPVTHRDPAILYLWFSATDEWILTEFGWTLWPSGKSIAECLS